MTRTRPDSCLLECVPNFSSGRDPAVLSELLRVARSTAGVLTLDHSSDTDHNRSVLTLAGPAPAIAEVAFRLVEAAMELIDLNQHRGVHPRMGATDVLPFIPLRPGDRDLAVDIAHAVGARIGRELSIPVYFYGAASQTPQRRLLSSLRRGGFEALRDAIGQDPARTPDEGPRQGIHPSAGATAVGVRPFLIAFNVDLETDDLRVAREIAGLIREQGGGLPGLRALGFPLPSRGLVQVSMNVTDSERAGLVEVFDTVERLARLRGVEVHGSELIGLAPASALGQGVAEHIRLGGYDPNLHVLEERLKFLQDHAQDSPPNHSD